MRTYFLQRTGEHKKGASGPGLPVLPVSGVSSCAAMLKHDLAYTHIQLLLLSPGALYTSAIRAHCTKRGAFRQLLNH